MNAKPALVVASALKPSASSTRAEPASHGLGITNGSPSWSARKAAALRAWVVAASSVLTRARFRSRSGLGTHGNRLRGHQRGRDQQEHRGHEQQRDDELDLRCGAGRALGMGAGGARASLGRLGLERRPERCAVARGAAERADERRDPRGRAAALEQGERVRRRDAERDGMGCAMQLRGQRAGMAPPHLGQRAAGDSPAATATRSRSSTSASSASSARRRAPARRRSHASGARNAAAAASPQPGSPSRPGRSAASGSAASSATSAAPAFTAITSPGDVSTPATSSLQRKPARRADVEGPAGAGDQRERPPRRGRASLRAPRPREVKLVMIGQFIDREAALEFALPSS